MTDAHVDVDLGVEVDRDPVPPARPVQREPVPLLVARICAERGCRTLTVHDRCARHRAQSMESSLP